MCRSHTHGFRQPQRGVLPHANGSGELHASATHFARSPCWVLGGWMGVRWVCRSRTRRPPPLQLGCSWTPPTCWWASTSRSASLIRVRRAPSLYISLLCAPTHAHTHSHKPFADWSNVFAADAPDQGQIKCSVECTTSASADFEGRGGKDLNVMLVRGTLELAP